MLTFAALGPASGRRHVPGGVLRGRPFAAREEGLGGAMLNGIIKLVNRSAARWVARLPAAWRARKPMGSFDLFDGDH